MTRIVCRECFATRYARLVSRDCEACGSVSWCFEHELRDVTLSTGPHVDSEVATLALADALGDAGSLGTVVGGCVRLVLVMDARRDLLEPPQRFALLGLLDALDPFDAREEEAS